MQSTLSAVDKRNTPDFGAIHDHAHRSPIVETAATALLSELEQPSGLGALYADSLVQAMVMELYRLGHREQKISVIDQARLCDRKLSLLNAYLNDNIETAIELNDLANLVGMSVTVFLREFKKKTGQTPYQFVLNTRLAKARTLIERTKTSLAEVALACGFSSQAHMTHLFSTRLGVTPNKLRHS